MNKEIIIETDRLVLRQYKLEDVDDIVEGLNNLNVTKWLQGAPYPYTKKDALDFINKSIDNSLYNFAIILKSENKVIGGTQLTNIDWHNGTAGGGIWIRLVKNIGDMDMELKLSGLELNMHLKN